MKQKEIRIIFDIINNQQKFCEEKTKSEKRSFTRMMFKGGRDASISIKRKLLEKYRMGEL